MENILNDFNSLLKNAEQLKKSIEQRFIQTGKDIDKIEDVTSETNGIFGTRTAMWAMYEI